jgi:hypothetical protein
MGYRERNVKVTKNQRALPLRKIAAVAAAASALSAPFLAVPAWGTPSTPAVPHPAPAPVPIPAPNVGHPIPTHVAIPAPINTPTRASVPPPPPVQHAPTQAPPQHTATAQPAAPKPGPAPAQPVQPGNLPTAAPAHPVQPGNPPTPIQTAASLPPQPREGPKPTQGPGTIGPSKPAGTPQIATGPSWQTTGPGGHPSAVIPRGGTSITVPVAAPPKGLPTPHEAIEAARLAPPTHVDPAHPPVPPPHVNFNEQVQTAMRVNADHDEGFRRWEYVDYDQYRRPTLFNPLPRDATFRYFYNGAYQTVWVPSGGRVLLNMDTVGVFPFTVAAGELISAGSFLGGAWIPPLDWMGPPPGDWQPWAPMTYSAVPVDFANLDQTVMVDRVTSVGHDDTLPAGQRDVVLLNDSTLGRGELQPSPDGGPPHITLQQTQQLPGVSQWNDGQEYINTAIEKPAKPAPPPDNDLPWIIGGLVAVLALLGGIAAWVWKHPRGIHAVPTANAPTETFDPVPSTEWLYNADGEPGSGGIAAT